MDLKGWKSEGAGGLRDEGDAMGGSGFGLTGVAVSGSLSRLWGGAMRGAKWGGAMLFAPRAITTADNDYDNDNDKKCAQAPTQPQPQQHDAFAGARWTIFSQLGYLDGVKRNVGLGVHVPTPFGRAEVTLAKVLGGKGEVEGDEIHEGWMPQIGINLDVGTP